MAWKKWAACFLAALLLCGLTACQDEKRVEGLVVELQTDEAGDITAFVVENGEKRTAVLLAEKTTVWPVGISSGSSAEFRAQFQKELQVDALANAWCYSRRESLETADGEKVPAYWAMSVHIDGGLRREALTLRDGTPVDVLEREYWGGRTYRLADGTELLRADEPMGPENVYVEGQKGFEDLSERAREKVRVYYEKQGLLYDEMEELEKSYAAYLELGEGFVCGHVSQEVTPTAASEKVMYFQTCVILPEEYGANLYQNARLCAAFDRESGERIDIRDLFGVSWPEVCRCLPELVDWNMDPAIAAQISEKLEPEYLSFHPDYMSVWLPAGILEGEEYPYGFSVSYSDAPEGFFRPWAIPESAEA